MEKQQGWAGASIINFPPLPPEKIAIVWMSESIRQAGAGRGKREGVPFRCQCSEGISENTLQPYDGVVTEWLRCYV